MSVPYQPKSFILSQCLLTPVSGNALDIRYMWQDIQIHEDLYGVGITITLSIVDALNLLKNLPIFGFETLQISFSTPNLENFTHTFCIYKIENRGLLKDRKQIYTLHGISQEVMTNHLTRVSKSYNGKLISDIVTDIQTNYLNSSFNKIDTSTYLQQIVVPNIPPMEAIRWLSTRANPANFPGSNYMYYENKDGYNFLTLENLVQQPASITYNVHPKNVIRYERGQTEIEIGVEDYKFQNHIDTLESNYRGMYGSRLITHNLNRKRFFQQDYSYVDSYPSYDHLEPNIAKNEITGNTGYTFLSNQGGKYNSPLSLLRFFPSGLQSEDFPNQVEQWAQERISRLQQFHTIHLNISVPGDSRRKAGEKILFKLPSPEELVNNEQPLDIYYSDAYLITAVNHTLTQQEYMTHMELKKDSVFESYP